MAIPATPPAGRDVTSIFGVSSLMMTDAERYRLRLALQAGFAILLRCKYRRPSASFQVLFASTDEVTELLFTYSIFSFGHEAAENKVLPRCKTIGDSS